ncbi:unnamed protein product [Brassica rapa]|uniref:Uncharacterized protein n=1 Tax=Brassica campestris TaxID=3711 RepID=A0A3P6D3P3_BRACM|nr:unnamed protein product [Brassica rapa]VDD17461.1 unnamed protein product [Brassica rapa]
MGGETNMVRETVEEEPLSPCSQPGADASGLFNSPDFNCAIIVTMECKVKGNPLPSSTALNTPSLITLASPEF